LSLGAFPLAVIAVVMMTLSFEALLAGEELVEEAFPGIENRDCSGFFDTLECIVDTVFGAVVYFFHLVTFAPGDPPLWVRVPLAVSLGGAIFWSLVTLIRGN